MSARVPLLILACCMALAALVVGAQLPARLACSRDASLHGCHDAYGTGSDAQRAFLARLAASAGLLLGAALGAVVGLLQPKPTEPMGASLARVARRAREAWRRAEARRRARRAREAAARPPPPAPGPEDPLQALKMRFAKGEIGEEEYARRARMLGPATPSRRSSPALALGAAGFLVGGLLGVLFRPSFLGVKIPAAWVLTAGATLGPGDELGRTLAQDGFAVMVACAVGGAVAGALIGHFALRREAPE
jgi:hypothetical protein